MCVAHTFDVVLQAKVAAFVYIGYFDLVRRHCVDRSPNPKPQPYLHLWGGVEVLFLCLISPPALRLGRGSGACCRLY